MPTSRECELEAEIRRLRAANRRLGDELDWAQEQVRVYRRLVERLVSTAHKLI